MFEVRPQGLVNTYFTGKERDSESGLDFFGARYYSGPHGRFTSPDPLVWNDRRLGSFLAGRSVSLPTLEEYISNPQNFNLYSYVTNNPLARVDVTGHWGKRAHDAMITHALRGRAPTSHILAIQKASHAFDKRTLSEKDLPMHSMRGPRQSAEDAIQKRNEFVETRMGDARGLAQQGDIKGALTALGEALHPLMDLTSPKHAEQDGTPKEFSGMLDWGKHVVGEDVSDLTPEVLKLEDQVIQAAYDYVFRQENKEPDPERRK
jgi:RHS repeat-associated protein